MTKLKRNLRYAESATIRNAERPGNALRDTGNDLSERDDFPVLPVLPGRIECLGYAGFGAVYASLATAPLWWDYDGLAIFGAILTGTVLCYAVLRGIVHIRWRNHCRKCRKLERADLEPVCVKLDYVNRDRVRGKRLGYVTPEMICEAARRLEGR